MCHTFLLRERESGGELGQITSSVSSSDLSLCFWFGTSPPTLLILYDKFVLLSPWFNPHQAAIELLVIAKHDGPLSTSPFNNGKCPISTSLLQPFKIQWNSPSHFPYHLHQKSCSMKLMKVNQIQSDTLEVSLKYSSPLPSPLHHTKLPMAQINVHPLPFNLLLTPSSSPVTHGFPSTGKQQSRRSFVLNYPPLPIPRLVCSSSASSSILSSPSSSKMNHLMPLPNLPNLFPLPCTTHPSLILILQTPLCLSISADWTFLQNLPTAQPNTLLALLLCLPNPLVSSEDSSLCSWFGTLHFHVPQTSTAWPISGRLQEAQLLFRKVRDIDYAFGCLYL